MNNRKTFSSFEERQKRTKKIADMYNIGWLSPRGDFYACELYGHSELAEIILKSITKQESCFLAEQSLVSMGYAKISVNEMLLEVSIQSKDDRLSIEQMISLRTLDLSEVPSIKYFINKNEHIHSLI